jgi:hypothetical protein
MISQYFRGVVDVVVGEDEDDIGSGSDVVKVVVVVGVVVISRSALQASTGCVDQTTIPIHNPNKLVKVTLLGRKDFHHFAIILWNESVLVVVISSSWFGLWCIFVRILVVLVLLVHCGGLLIRVLLWNGWVVIVVVVVLVCSRIVEK